MDVLSLCQLCELIAIAKNKVNGTLRYDGKERTQFLNFVIPMFRNLILTTYAAVENKTLEYERVVLAQWHILNIRCQCETHPTGWESWERTQI